MFFQKHKKINFRKILLIIIFIILVLTIGVFIYIGKNIVKTLKEDSVANQKKIDILDGKIKDLEVENYLDEIFEDSVQDPYSRSFQTVDDSFSIIFKDIQEYGSGTKIIFSLLNKDSISYSNISLNFQLRDSDNVKNFEVLSYENYKMLDEISSGFAREDYIIVKDVKPSQIKSIRVTTGEMTMRYYNHN